MSGASVKGLPRGSSPTTDRLLALWKSGELTRAAAKVTTREALAAAIGMSDSQYGSAAKRLQGLGHAFPRFKRGGGLDDIGKPDIEIDVSDFADEEPTNPGLPPPRTVDDDLAERKERSQVSDLKRRLADALDQLADCRVQLGAASDAVSHRSIVEPIRPRQHATSALREATFVALASDWHIEERVDPAKVNGVNEYNLEIARRRVERYFVGLIYMLRYHSDHFAIRDMIQWLGGDLITGYLRDEDREDNECSPVQAIAHLHVWIEEGIRSVLSAVDIETINVVCNSGNHGRLTKKVQPRTREENSIEWLLYVGLARAFANEPRVKFTLPHGVMTYVEVYDWILRFTHGDATKYGGGVGGIMIPIRKAIAKWDTVRRAHCTIMGHYHTEHFLRDLVVNGSLVGYNEYALEIAAPFEEPRQSCFLVDKHRGVTMPATIYGEEHGRRRA